MIELLGYLPHERWAFFKEDDEYKHIKPGALLELITASTENNASSAMYHGGYTLSGQKFETMKELRAFLSEKSVAAWEEYKERK